MNIGYNLINDYFIIENDDTKNFISIIKVINLEINFNIFFDIDYNVDSILEKKYIINNVSDEDNSINIGTPITIKKSNDNKIYLLGIIYMGNYFYIFNKEDLLDIKKKLNIIDIKYKIIQIEKLNFNNKSINNDKMTFIFKYNFNNLLYLNLENNKITNDGLIRLQNKSLKKLEYLNLSENNISDNGLKNLYNLSNLKELILLKMNLSNQYFYILENCIPKTIKIIECDIDTLKISKISENFNNFKLPNLKNIEFISPNDEYLKILFSLDNICSPLKQLYLSTCGDKEITMIKKNINKLKSIEVIDLKDITITQRTYKYLKYLIELKNIKLLFDKKKLNFEFNNFYKILLFGSTISGKTSYCNYCKNKKPISATLRTIGMDFIKLHPSFDQNILVYLYDISSLSAFRGMAANLKNCDGILLLFDITSREDFEELNYYLDKIKEEFYLDNYPVLLIANKIDNEYERKIEKREIEDFVKNNNLIGYFEVSCISGVNVIESFDYLVDYINQNKKQCELFINQIKNNN